MVDAPDYQLAPSVTEPSWPRASADDGAAAAPPPGPTSDARGTPSDTAAEAPVRPPVGVVIPVFNEEDSVAALHQQLVRMAANHKFALEIVFVDDGSTDASWRRLGLIAAQDASVTLVRLKRRFGKSAALAAGLALVKAGVVFTMDADLQDDPAEIPRFLLKADEGFDLVVGWKKVRHDPWHKTIPSRVFNSLVSRTTGVHLHDHNCGFKCLGRGLVEHLRLAGDRHRFIPVLADAAGFRVAEIVVTHHARRFGRSKYGLDRFLKGFLDLYAVLLTTRFAERPIHLLGVAGCGMIAAGAALGLSSMPLPAWLGTIVGNVGWAGVLLGGQAILAGLLAEAFVHRRRVPDGRPYVIETTTPAHDRPQEKEPRPQ